MILRQENVFLFKIDHIQGKIHKIIIGLLTTLLRNVQCNGTTLTVKYISIVITGSKDK